MWWLRKGGPLGCRECCLSCAPFKAIRAKFASEHFDLSPSPCPMFRAICRLVFITLTNVFVAGGGQLGLLRFFFHHWSNELQLRESDTQLAKQLVKVCGQGRSEGGKEAPFLPGLGLASLKLKGAEW